MQRVVRRNHQKGAVIITVALVMLFLLGFMGIALDFGHLFIAKTELQTAMDSCALSAAQELDGKSDALTRAVSAGMSAGNLNNVNFQSPTWNGQGQIVDTDITFRDAAYAPTTVAANATYAQCAHTQPAIRMWLLHMMGTFSGAGAAYPNTQNVSAFAVATRGNSQSICPVPIALKPKLNGTAPGTAPNYGFAVGDWVTLIMAQNGAQGGEIGWANLDGSNNAAETEAELNGHCGTKIGDTLGTPGVQTSVVDVWNYRFGIYKNTGDPAVNRPDFTGYSYTSINWPGQNNAYGDFLNKRLAFASCADMGTKVQGANSCESITGLSLNSFQKLAAPGNTTGGHKQYGSNRRVITIPVINGAAQVIDYACMLMLQPLSIPMADVQLEFLGNAGAAGSPCAPIGKPGTTVGPKVPVLVR